MMSFVGIVVAVIALPILAVLAVLKVVRDDARECERSDAEPIPPARMLEFTDAEREDIMAKGW